jgi:hypothetical protein
MRLVFSPTIFVPFGVQSKNQNTEANFSSLEALNKKVNGGDA